MSYVQHKQVGHTVVTTLDLGIYMSLASFLGCCWN